MYVIHSAIAMVVVVSQVGSAVSFTFAKCMGGLGREERDSHGTLG